MSLEDAKSESFRLGQLVPDGVPEKAQALTLEIEGAPERRVRIPALCSEYAGIGFWLLEKTHVLCLASSIRAPEDEGLWVRFTSLRRLRRFRPALVYTRVTCSWMCRTHDCCELSCGPWA